MLRAISRMQDLIVTASRGFGRLPGGGWLVDEAWFRFFVNFEIEKAQRLRYSISVVFFAVEPSGAQNGEATSLSLATHVMGHIRGTDVVAPWMQGQLAILLVDAEINHLPSILDRLTGQLEASVWSAGGASYPRSAARADDIVHQAIELLGRAREEGGNRLYVAP